ncbi:hypothetical protein B0H13DRAFT_2042275, partial [Mycena leptocephala]
MLYRFPRLLRQLLCFGISAPDSDSTQIAPLPCFLLLSGNAAGPWTLSTFLSFNISSAYFFLSQCLEHGPWYHPIRSHEIQLC